MMRWHYLVTPILAGGVTFSLALLMQAIIETEFVPQPKDRVGSSLKTYILKPQVIICGGYRGAKGWSIPQFPLLLPPYTNIISDPSFENPHDDYVEYRAPKPDYLGKDIKIDMPTALIETSSCHGNHGVRRPPKLPVEFLSGNMSGLCKFSFIYDAEGQASEIDILSCTHEVLAPVTRKAVRSWRLSGANCSSESLPSQRKFSKMRYDLLDEDGDLLPLP